MENSKSERINNLMPGNKGTAAAADPTNKSVYETEYERILGEYSDVKMLNGMTIETDLEVEICSIKKGDILDRICERLHINSFEQRLHIEEKLNKDGKGMTVQLLTHEPGAPFAPEDEELTPEQEEEELKLYTVPVPATEEELQELAAVCYRQYQHRRFYRSVLTMDADKLLRKSKDPADVVSDVEDYANRLFEAVTTKDFEKYQHAFVHIVESKENLPEEKKSIFINAMAPLFNSNLDKEDINEFNRFSVFPCWMWLFEVVPAVVIRAASDFGFVLEYAGGNDNEVRRLHDLLDGLEERAKQVACRLYPFEEDQITDDGTAAEPDSAREFRLQLFAEDNPIEALEHQSFAYPSNYVQDITKTGKTLFDRAKPLDVLRQVQIDVLPNTENKDCYVLVDLDINAISTTDNITEFDGMVLNAIYSILETGQTVFTAKQVAYIVYRGGNSASSVSPKQVGAITKSIEKMRLIDLTVNWEQHAHLKKLPENITGYKETGYLLPVKRHEFISSGQKVKGYQLIDAPPLYSYSKAVGQINTAPMQALDIPGLRMDDEKATMREYMLTQIGHMKHNKRFSKNMTLEAIMRSAGIEIDELPKDKKSNKTKHIETMLQRFREIGYIKNYDIVKKGRSLHAVKIIL